MAKSQGKVSSTMVEVKGNKLVITLPLINPPRESSSGKTLLVATTGGNKETNLKIKGKSVIVGVNAYIYNE